jgi:hypothetical protein
VRLAGGFHIQPIISGADELYKLEFWRRPVKVGPQGFTSKADKILGVLQRGKKFRASLRDHV